MRVKNHFLEGVPQILSPHHGGRLLTPTIIVLHYTASGEGRDGDARFFASNQATTSAHLTVSREGETTQCVPFNVKAWHAGKSIWRGVSNCNDYSIGIEIDNWGLLDKRADGKFYSCGNIVIPQERVYIGPNKLGAGQYWETYPVDQQLRVAEDCRAIVAAYPSIKEIVGHEDIAPRRKCDPGPALYDFIRKLNNDIFDNGRAGPTHEDVRTVIGSTLNVRSEPSITASLIGSLRKNDEVTVLYDAGLWCQITYNGSTQAWVSDKFLSR